MLVDQAGDSMYFTGNSADANVLMRYRDMTVLDASQRRLDARMEWIDSEHFAIVVNDSDAQYPIFVDPLMSDGTVYTTQSGSLFGYCVAYLVTYDYGSALVGQNNVGGLLVGAPYFDPGNAPQAGKIFLYDTGATVNHVLPSTPTWSYAGTVANEHVGWSASDGALVNYDADMIVGGPYADGPPCNNVQVLTWGP